MTLARSVTLHTRRGGTWCWRKGLAVAITFGALVFIILRAMP